MDYKIRRLDELEGDHRQAISQLYVEAFQNKMTIMSRDVEILARIFKDSFIPSMYYVCLDGDKIIGIIACSNSKQRANSFEKDVLIKEFGYIRGRIYIAMINSFLTTPNARTEDEGYIESLATHPDYRGKGIATALLDHAHNKSGYNKYILDVIHGNEGAKALYERIGYNTYKTEKGIFLKLLNIKELYYMEFSL
ncbi:GNAT family N-acetyltransferase [Clostridium paraputrificum]|uniref:GNAT family N-acetyltransferase n=1 Tax=Clostridium paraputrificum TaxID=29363 RepID=UPI003D32F973